MKVGPYEVLRKLGEGAYGKVYLARKGGSSSFVTWYALKRIAKGKARGEDFEAYLQREAQVGGLVNHPNLVRVHEVLSLGKEWVLVQDYVDGVTLGSVLADQKARSELVPWEASLELVAELLETLHYLHTLRDPEGRETGFVHRDVKPGNVMITEGHGIRVMDFGVARGDEAGVGTLAGELRGTLAFMAPEQATGGEVGPASDQFAAALILLELLTNCSPWGDVRGAAVLGRVVTGDVSHGLEQIVHDEQLEPILHRMLAREPGQRFPTAADAATALRTVRAQTPTPPALRPFCIEAVQRLRSPDREEVDDEPSWTGSFRWTAAAPGMAPSVEIDSLGPAGSSLSGLGEDSLGPAAAAPACDGDDDDDDALDEGLDLDDEPVVGAGGGLALIDSHATLPLETSPAQRAALLAALGGGEAHLPADGRLRMGTGETLEALQARLGDVDPMSTLPIGPEAGRRSGGAAAPAEADSVAGLPPVPAPPSIERAGGEPARAGAHPAPTVAAQPTQRRRKRAAGAQGKARRPVQASVGAQLWAQFVASPLLGTLLLLGALLLIAGTARLAWMAVVSEPEQAAEVDLDDEELLRLPGEGLAARQREAMPPVAVPPPTPAEAADAAPDLSDGDEAPSEPAEGPPEPTLVHPGPGPASDAAEEPFEGPEGDPRDAVAAAVPAPEPPRPPSKPGADLDADLASWRGDRPDPTPAPRRLQEGQIIAGSGSGERLLADAEGERAVATRRSDGTDAPRPAPAAAPTSPHLRFLSSDEQPVGAPLSVRVRSDGFYASAVVVYYQWRGEGAAGRKRRSLRQQGDGSFALEIPASELKVDRLQLWFAAEPGNVLLGDAGAPVEVRVR